MNTPASASTWHKGLPSIVRRHKLWVGQKRWFFGSFKHKQFYSRHYVSFRGKNSRAVFFDESVPYATSDGITYTSELFNNSWTYEQLNKTRYRKVNKTTYEIKSGLKQRSGWPDMRYRVQKNGKKMNISSRRLWNHIDPNRGNNRSQKKWQQLGKFEYVKKATLKKAEHRDPLHRR